MGWGLTIFRWVGDSLIAHARNVCLGKFLESECTEILFLDSDVSCGPGVFTRMMTHRVDMVAGVYRVKLDEERYPVMPLPEAELREDARTGLMEVACVPFGFVRMTRELVEAYVAKDPDAYFETHLAPGLKVPFLFNTEVIDHIFWGEDFYFCRRLREHGWRIFVDHELVLHHSGYGKRFTGCLGEFIGRPQ